VPSKRRLNLWWRAGGPRGLALFRRVRALRGAGALLGAFALLVQVWLPVVHHPALAAAGGGSAQVRTASFLGDGLTLCLAARERSQPPGKAPSHGSTPCPICQTLQIIGSFVPPAGPVVVASLPLAMPGDAIAQAPLLAGSPRPTSQPRAPPLMA